MSDTRGIRIQPVAPAAAPGRVRPVGADDQRGQPRQQAEQHAHADRSAETGGRLRACYAETIVDSETDEVLLRVCDAASTTVLQQIEPAELERLSATLRSYSAMLARCALTRARTPA